MLTVADPVPGRVLVRADVVGTVVIVIAGVAGLMSSDLARTVLTPVSFALAAVGIVTFLWSYASAIERSRTAEIAVSQLYVVAGEVAPPGVKRALRWALWAQIAVAVGVMVVGFSRTKPQEFNWAATVIVVPLFGLGMNGMWVARHGTFGPRILTPRSRRRSAPIPDPTPEMEQDSPHG